MESVSERNSIKLDNIALQVNTIEEKLSTVEKDVAEIKTDVKDLRKAVYGNGDPTAGIMGRVKSLEDWREGQVWYQRVIIALVLAELVALFLTH